MMKKIRYFLCASLLLSGCGTMQQMIKSSFPYTTTLTIPASGATGVELTAVSRANSFDQNFSRSGNLATHINKVRIVSAKLRSEEPSDFNIGSLSWVKIYLSKADGSDEVLVAAYNVIPRTAGNELTLTADNSNFLDEHVRDPYVRVRMIYQLRKKAEIDTRLKIVLSLTADKAEE